MRKKKTLVAPHILERLFFRVKKLAQTKNVNDIDVLV